MVIFKNIFGDRGPEFGSMMGFERTENLEFHKNAKLLDLIDKY
jgi:hypothetical protein